jgi:DNA/RNA endonuclease G, NUC1
MSRLQSPNEQLLSCTGFNPKFIDNKTSISLAGILPATYKAHLPNVPGNNKGILHYTDMSILYNTKRKLPFTVAYNLDGIEKATTSPKTRFKRDPRIPAHTQLYYDFYQPVSTSPKLEIGHMASNAEMSRGKDAKQKAAHTFHFTNTVPQSERLNAGLWRSLENYIIKEATTAGENKKVIVLTGPVLTNIDPAYKLQPGFRIPLLFYKVVVFMCKGHLYSTAFIMSHAKKLINDGLLLEEKPAFKKHRKSYDVDLFTDFPYREIFQVNILFLEKLSGLSFTWKNVKKINVPEKVRHLIVIHNTGNAADAKAFKTVRHGRFTIPTTRYVPESAALNEEFKLNMALPR